MKFWLVPVGHWARGGFSNTIALATAPGVTAMGKRGFDLLGHPTYLVSAASRRLQHISWTWFARLAAVRVMKHCIHTRNTPTTPQRRGARGTASLSTLPLSLVEALSLRPPDNRVFTQARPRPQVQRPLRGHGLGLHHTPQEKHFSEPEAALGLCSTIV